MKQKDKACARMSTTLGHGNMPDTASYQNPNKYACVGRPELVEAIVGTFEVDLV